MTFRVPYIGEFQVWKGATVVGLAVLIFYNQVYTALSVNGGGLGFEGHLSQFTLAVISVVLILYLAREE